MNKTIKKENLLSSFPYVLSGAKNISALGKISVEEFINLFSESNKLAFIESLNSLDEKVLDLIAANFRIEWYDVDGKIEEKRENIKNCWIVHKKMGTVQGMKAALKSIYSSIEIKEWFQYNGEPFHYKIQIDDGDKLTNIKILDKVIQKIKIFSNVRSILDNIEIITYQKSILNSSVIVHICYESKFIIN